MSFTYARRTIPTGYQGTLATLEEMKRLIREGTLNERLRMLAIQIIRGQPWKDRLAECRAIFQWIRRNIRFTYDPSSAELVQDVDTILNHKAADCDDFVILSGSMLQAIGIPVRIVIIGTDASQPAAFSHVYLQADIRGKWVGFDPSVVESYVGWEPPVFASKRTIEVGE